MAEARAAGRFPAPRKRGTKLKTMKRSMKKHLVGLAISLALPLGAIAAAPAKPMTEQGTIQKIDLGKKEFSLKEGGFKRESTFAWNGSTRIMESGKSAGVTALKAGEQASVTYTRHGKERLASEIVVVPVTKAMAAPSKSQ